jgi:hypothetical protein
MGHDLSIAFQSLSEIEINNICQNGRVQEADAVISFEESWIQNVTARNVL